MNFTNDHMSPEGDIGSRESLIIEIQLHTYFFTQMKLYEKYSPQVILCNV